MNHILTVARRKAGGDPEWNYFKWRRVGKGADCVVVGGVPKIIKSGMKKGQKTFRSVPLQEVVVTESEINAEFDRYEAETGLCGDCGGKGSSFASWNRLEGTKTTKCGRCDGTGRAGK